jgi:ribosomal peptide maturation radical SAM protein 1
MPFAVLDEPALGVSTLKGQLQHEGVECDIAYLNLSFARLLGLESYARIGEGLPFTAFAGEWVFAPALYARDQPDPSAYVSNVLKETWRISDEDLALLTHARDLAPRFITESYEEVDWQKYQVIGFTSFCAQNIASLALARLIKERHPKSIIAFGGANWTSPMGQALLEAFPFVDLACSGEAECSLPRLLRDLCGDAGEQIESIPGLILRQGPRALLTGPPSLVSRLDDLPAPDFADYFKALSDFGLGQSVVPSLPVEMSRGCWWASREPCTFCGLNGEIRPYRAKTGERIEQELRDLASCHPCQLIEVVDNVVPATFFDEVLPALVRNPLKVPLFVSVRPTITHEQVRQLAAMDALIQPGIESLSDRVLTIMNKGTRSLENVRLLKWCRAEGLRAYWNVIYGSPGEEATDYEAMIDLMHNIGHLPPPEICSPLSVERFSRYFERPEMYGISDLRPLTPYRHIYPLEESRLRDVAGFFEYSCASTVDNRRQQWALRHEVAEWRQGWRDRSLRYIIDDTGNVIISDARPEGHEREIRLEGLDAALYIACHDIRTEADLMAIQGDFDKTGDPESNVHERLHALMQLGVLASDGERYLGLALLARSS